MDERDMMLVACLPYARKLAWRFYHKASNQPYELEELEAQAILDMVELYPKFDASRGAAFGTFLRTALPRRLLDYHLRVMRQKSANGQRILCFAECERVNVDGEAYTILEFVAVEDIIEAVETLYEFRQFFLSQSERDRFLMSLHLYGYTREECVALVNERYQKTKPRSPSYVSDRLHILRQWYANCA